MTLQAQYISEWDDPRVDVYRDVRDADLRGRDGLFMAESELVIRRLIRTPHRLHSLLLCPERFARLEPALRTLPNSVPVYVVELRLMHEIAAFHIHRGVLAAGFRLSDSDLSLDAVFGDWRDQTRQLCMLLAEGITNVDNMGALFRNAAAFGVHGIVLDPTCCDPLYRKAIRVSMGHALSIPYAVSRNWPDDLLRLKNDWGMTIIAAESHERAEPLWNICRSNRIGIVLGSEGSGLGESTLRHCESVVAIPMAADVPSINVAVASAVVLYELKRPSRP